MSAKPSPRSPATAAGKPWYRRRRLWIPVIFLAMCLVAWAARAPLLSAVGRWWIVDRPPEMADAIVVLGGGIENRPAKAAELYHMGLAPRVLVLKTEPLPSSKLGVTPDYNDFTRLILLKLGVPESAIILIGDEVSSTQEEAEAVKTWVGEHGAGRILIPTDPFHTRRVTWFFGRVLEDQGVKVVTVAVEPLNYEPEDWWRSEGGVIAFQNEIIKTIFYWWKY